MRNCHKIKFPFDKYKRQISSEGINNIVQKTETVLVEACNAKDKALKVKDAPKWKTEKMSIVVFDADDTGKYTDLPNRDKTAFSIEYITNVELSVNDDELLMLASVLSDPYFDSLEPYNQNKYVKRITYENAEQSRTNPFYQHYSNNIDS